ncbi:MAG: hypothetical protein QXZ47_04800 [Candidatus Bathyarchaeia archaeon]
MLNFMKTGKIIREFVTRFYQLACQEGPNIPRNEKVLRDYEIERLSGVFKRYCAARMRMGNLGGFCKQSTRYKPLQKNGVLLKPDEVPERFFRNGIYNDKSVRISGEKSWQALKFTIPLTHFPPRAK